MDDNKRTYIKKNDLDIHDKANFSLLSANQIREKIRTEEDFIYSKKHDYSLLNFLKKDKKALTDKNIAHFLKMTLKDLQDLYESTIKKIRANINI